MAAKQARLRSSKPRISTPSDAVADAVLNNSGSDEVESSQSRQAKKSTIVEVKKFSAQIDKDVLEDLHRFYLQLQMDLGRDNAPYKEVIAEEAISQFLEYARQNRESVLDALMERQGMRA